ncbi:MAG: ImmA/IrrE family metallo-endopeptidase [Candidatus Contendobacter sp.]
MKANRIDLSYQPDPSPAKAADGWGAGMLWLNGRAFWFFSAPEAPQPVVWTWIDLLEHLAACWPWLRIESPWPLDWLAAPMLEGSNFWHVADDRWQVLDEAAADGEEARLLDFAHRHNLAAGWQGLQVPALYWYRLGQDVRLCPEGLSPIVLPFAEAIAVLERLGNEIAAGLNASAQPRARQALAAWAARERVALRRRIEIATGLEDPVLAEIQAGQADESFWNLSQVANDHNFAANSLLAAARMTTGKLDPPRVAAVLGLLRALPPARVLPRLEALTQQLQTAAWLTADTPFTQGYALAGALCEALGLAESQVFEPDHWLAEWGVAVQSASFGTVDLEAIAVWGDRGPAILVNDAPNIRPAHRFGHRFVLAHEIGHLLADRARALPAAEVLGGQILPAIEQRANAFAAEILLPRRAAARSYRQATSLEAAVKGLVEAFEVSRLVAKTQIKNSNAASGADLAEIEAALNPPGSSSV